MMFGLESLVNDLRKLGTNGLSDENIGDLVALICIANGHNMKSAFLMAQDFVTFRKQFREQLKVLE